METRRFRRTQTGRASAAGDEARERILEVAVALIADKGYRGTSIAQVAAAAGISQSGLLHHFPSKQDLLIAVLDHRSTADTELFDRSGATITGWEALDGWTALARHNEGQPPVVRLFVTLAAEATDPVHPAHPWLQRHFRLVTEELATAIRAGVADGSMRADLPIDALVSATVAVMDGLQLQWLAGADLPGLAEAFAGYVELIREGWAS